MADEEDLRHTQEGRSDLAGFVLDGAELPGFDFRGRTLLRTNLQRANLSRAILSGCDLSHSKLVHANLSGAQCEGTIFRGALFGINFKNANLQNARFERPLFQNCKLDEADLRGAQFIGARFSEGNSIANATFDDRTNFEGAQMPRPLSRETIFSAYAYERGQLRRLAAKLELEVTSSAGEAVPEQPTGEADKQAHKATIASRLNADPSGAKAIAIGLTLTIRNHLEELKSTTPNEEAQLERHRSYVDLLENLVEGLEGIATALESVTPENPDAQEAVSNASLLVQNVANAMGNFVTRYGPAVVDLSVLGAGTAFLSYCGAHGTIAMGTTLLLMKRDDLFERLGKILTSKSITDK